MIGGQVTYNIIIGQIQFFIGQIDFKMKSNVVVVGDELQNWVELDLILETGYETKSGLSAKISRQSQRVWRGYVIEHFIGVSVDIELAG